MSNRDEIMSLKSQNEQLTNRINELNDKAG